MGKHERKRSLGGRRRKWRDDIKTDLKQRLVWRGLHSPGSVQVGLDVTGCCGHGNEHSGSIKFREFYN
jgi:hypothetical protein